MRVTPPDLEDFLTKYVRAAAAADGLTVEVGNKERPDLKVPLTKPMIVIRDDPGSRLSVVTFDRSIGASVLAGTRLNDKPAKDLSRWLFSVLLDEAIVEAPNSPIASVEWDGSNGPYSVTEALDVSRQYMTAQYTVVGAW